MKYGYNENGDKIYENIHGYYYDENGDCYYVYKPSINHTKWNKEKREWEWEIPAINIEKYKKEIESYKSQILETGFIFNGHIQKCRDKDLALLSNAISALEDSGEEGRSWAFSDDDIVKISLDQFKQMRIVGMSFITTVYGIEALLKRSEPDLNLNLEKFKKMIDEKSEVKVG